MIKAWKTLTEQTCKRDFRIKVYRKNIEREKPQTFFRNPEFSKAMDLDSCT